MGHEMADFQPHAILAIATPMPKVERVQNFQQV